MAHQYTNHGDRSTDYLSTLHANPSNLDEFKSSYDDLIDQYAEPYSRISTHQTFRVQTDLTSDLDSRRPSYSLDKKNPYNVGKGEEIEDDPAHSLPQAYPPRQKQEKIVDNRSFVSRVLPDSWACRLFVITVVVETAIDLAIEGDLLVRLQDGGDAESESAKKMPVYLSIFALAHIFQLVLAVDAVYARNTLQFICLILFNLLFLIYAVIQIGEIQGSTTTSDGPIHIPVNVLTNIIPGVISAAELAYIALGWKIYKEFGWKVYKFLGADRRIKKMYASYQIFQCLVKFDLFFWIGFTVQFLWLVLEKSDWEYYVTLAALPLSIILLIEGHLAARYENKWMMATFMSGCIGALVYFIYKLYKLLKYRNTDYADVWHSLTTFSAIAIFLLLITIAFTIIVMRNFGRGLKNSIARSTNHARTGSQPFHRGPMSMNPNRMSID
ncbi:hypothetical protein F5J12DRAFT_834710 [Pisolithus orientalis]|uniref:uncharacterized protein n=1 Tax=Pisolithus orientalis TaxID=936130 RepID=UPI0022249F7F|nr:uncharacterized protein F5J12DRAFT_834710 [Pisolithus orientalis]KAI6005099.1 hypothetical protein F5J12DRAFT_834710 [Pisolithus orientalis]